MKKIINLLLLLVAITYTSQSVAQPTYPINGVYDEREGAFAFTNATIHTHYNKSIENATLLIKDGKIEAIGKGTKVPKGLAVIDLKGKHIYPSFIDMYANYGMPAAKKVKRDWSKPPQFISKKSGAYGWNQAIRPEVKANEIFKVDEKAAKEFWEIGFGTVLSHQKDGIARGTSVLVTLNDERENEVVLKDNVSAHYAFSKGSSLQAYPSSLMGSIALIQQTFHDANWYKDVQYVEEYNISLDHWNKTQNLPQIFETRDRLEILRADKLGDEFNVQYIFKGSGDEYQRIDALKATRASVIIPLDYPDAYDVEDPFDATNVDLKDMKHWELAPSNPHFLAKAGINFALTTADLKKKKDFLQNLKKAVKRGLSEEDALKALTYTPATLLKAYEKVGSLERGKVANFIITSDAIFAEKSKIHENWIAGQRHRIADFDPMDITGNYNLKIGDKEAYKLVVSGKAADAKANIMLNDSVKIPVKHTLNDQSITFSFDAEKDTISNNKGKLGKGTVRLSGWVNKNDKSWKGKSQDADGQWLTWSATRTGDAKEEDKKADKTKSKKEKGKQKAEDKPEELGTIIYPFTAYGWEKAPEKETVLFKNATVWTNEKDGILTETDVLIKNGKIAQIGKKLITAGGRQIDATGKHLTCGIIDEHSHIAISKGVNEGTQSSSAEVSIANVVNSEDVNLYRQLAGGVTTAQLLHGSANPIGGQSAIIKFRWGSTPEEMQFEGAAPFIKFALGENVKQSNWGDNNRIRFPQTRMGVEQVYMDAFTRAKEYEKAKKSGKKVRKDIELETILQIMNKERFITCHSYVQSEINMLMKTAEKFGFTINTFTHILEGYKVADKMKKHGAAGSTFSDWWAYKYEVIDAIPYNAAIMDEMGVMVSLNSDDAEMGRRLNQEAGKIVKYGNVSEENAWKMVTLNPAKILHIDNRVGSIKTGKDADIVLWSDNPLSIYARAEYTFVDGKCMFEKAQDEERRTYISQERNRLIQKMLKVKEGGGKTQKAMFKKAHHYHCDTVDEE